jgi:hypothetical protein
MSLACWTHKAKNKHTEYAILLPFQCKNIYTEASPCNIISTLRLLLHINQVNKARIRIPPFPFPIIFNATTFFSNNIHIHILTYLSTYVVIMCSQCRSPERTRHTVHIRTFFINIRHSVLCCDQRCEECHV